MKHIGNISSTTIGPHVVCYDINRAIFARPGPHQGDIPAVSQQWQVDVRYGSDLLSRIHRNTTSERCRIMIHGKEASEQHIIKT